MVPKKARVAVLELLDSWQKDVLRRRVADRLGTGTITLPLLPQLEARCWR